MTETPSKRMPSLMGGLLICAGSLLPGLRYGNMVCCGWGIAGGAYAAYWLINRSPLLPITRRDGAAVGALSGIVGSLLVLPIYTPLSPMRLSDFAVLQEQRSATAQSEVARETLKQIAAFAQNHTVLFPLLIWLLFAIVCTGMAAVGGVFGVAMFEKRKGQRPPSTPEGLRL